MAISPSRIDYSFIKKCRNWNVVKYQYLWYSNPPGGTISLKEVDTVAHLAKCVFLSPRNLEIGMLSINVCDILIHQYVYIYIATTLSANTANLSVPSIHGFPHSKWGPFSQNKEASLAILIYTSYISSFTYTHTLNPSINQPAENWDIAQSLPNSSYVVNDGACKTRGCRSRVRLGGDKWSATIIGKTGPLDWVCHSNHGVWPIYLHELLKLLGYMIYM